MKVQIHVTAAALLFAVSSQYAGAQSADPRAQAAALIDAGQAAEACAVLNRTFGIDAIENDVRLMQAHCAWKSGNAEEAIRHYRKLIERLPNAARPRAELATLYVQLGRQDEAIAEFDVARELDPGASAINVLGGLARAMASEDPSVLARAIPKNWQVELYTGLVYDSNINSGPQGTTIAGVIGGVPVELTLNANSRPISSWGNSTHLTGRYVHALNPKLALLAQGSVAKTFYFRDGDFNNDSAAASLGLLYRDGSVSASLQPSVRISRQANEIAERTYGLSGRVSNVVATGLRVTGSAGYFKRDTPKNNARNADGYLGSVGFNTDISPALQVGAEYMAQTENAREKFESRTLHGPVVFGTWNMQPGLSLTGSYRFAFIKHDAVQGIFPQVREDDHHIADFGMLWDVSKYVYPGTALRVQYTYIRADSNLALFDNQRHIVAVGMQLVF